MKRIISVWNMGYLVLSLASSCHTVRHKTKTDQHNRFQYAQTVFVSDSAVRYWHFSSDSTFSYHPDSGLRTLSGRLMGWELRVNHQKEQHTLDSVISRQHNETELKRNSRDIWPISYTFFVWVVAIFVIAFFVVGRK
ncbi:hypothetical protein H8B06_16240 [Sphingobacterium sp. DN00404]|uniref:Lipoprotein n=1 Tax=Sphingobacterium micropteri TaxID=2763501 RepID=A0ABR7YT83_9SPHI|nr:hypothetical protein [Sphingobacterium micropteri]MBD1434383.1 hypothetical protein [Sphingobacterium micropteri]